MFNPFLFNPFDMRGPDFLIFYIGVGVVFNVVLRSLILKKEKQNFPAHWDYTDPYKTAFLRAGASEVLRVMIFSLIDRGLLKSADDKIVAEPKAGDLVKRPEEQNIVRFFARPRKITEVFSDPAISRAWDGYHNALISEGLLSGQAVYLQRMPAVLAAIVLLLGISGTKIVIALMRGRHNISLLVILTVFFTAWALTSLFKQRTGAGDEVMRQLKLRFHSLKLRAGSLRPGGMTNDTVFLAAVFGLAALPDYYFPYVKTVFQKATTAADGSGYTGGCGSGDSGSSGGCGGGGCGGGCGGCGS
ncbi:MAG: hypothetical protein C0402_01855 [Thermodesulfovibrio sp.]|nr:hypothetical protein [Thermodesulfovibrio sp.]